MIRGETHHFEIVANESAARHHGPGRRPKLAIGNGILTVEDEDQAWARARVSEGDKGGGAARACLDLIALRKRLPGLGAMSEPTASQSVLEQLAEAEEQAPSRR